MDRRSWAGQVVNLVDLDIERERHIVTQQLKATMLQQMLYVTACATKEIVGADDVGALGQEPFAKMRAEEAGAAGDQYPLFQVHGNASLSQSGTGARSSNVMVNSW